MTLRSSYPCLASSSKPSLFPRPPSRHDPSAHRAALPANDLGDQIAKVQVTQVVAGHTSERLRASPSVPERLRQAFFGRPPCAPFHRSGSNSRFVASHQTGFRLRSLGGRRGGAASTDEDLPQRGLPAHRRTSELSAHRQSVHRTKDRHPRPLRNARRRDPLPPSRRGVTATDAAGTASSEGGLTPLRGRGRD